MTCSTKGCGNIQCYVCSKDCSNYGHFNDASRGGKEGQCPLFDSPGSLDKRHEEEVKAAELKARAQVIQENPEIPPEAFQFRFANGVAGREALPIVPPAMQQPLGPPLHLPQPVVVVPPLPAAAGHLVANAERYRREEERRHREEERRRTAIDQAKQRAERAAAAVQAQANAQVRAAAQAQIRASMEVIIHSHPGSLREVQAAYCDRLAAQAQPIAPAQVAAQPQAAAHVQVAPPGVAPRPHAFRYPSGNPNHGAGPPMGQRPPIIDLTDDDDAPAYRRYL